MEANIKEPISQEDLASYVGLSRRETSPADQHMPFSDALATAHTASQVYNEEMQQHAQADED